MSIFKILNFDNHQTPTANELHLDESIICEHKLEGFVFSKWREKLPETHRAIYQSRWKAQWARNQYHLIEYENIRSAFKNIGVQPVALKGCALVNSIYPDLGGRFMSDIDILVPNLKLVEAPLQALGYVLQNERKWKANDYKSVYFKNVGGTDLTLEVHENLTHRQSYDFYSRSQELNGVFCLRHEEMIVHLCIHLAYQHTFLKLHWLLDIDLYIRRFQNEIDWNRVDEMSLQLKRNRAVHTTLYAARQFFETPVPENFVRAPSILRKIITASNLAKGRANPTYYLLKHFVRDSILDSLDYDFHWLAHKLRSSSIAWRRPTSSRE